MAVDFQEVSEKARTMITAAKTVLDLADTVERGTEKATGKALAAVTITELKTIDGPAARTAANVAWDALDTAMTP